MTDILHLLSGGHGPLIDSPPDLQMTVRFSWDGEKYAPKWPTLNVHMIEARHMGELKHRVKNDDVIKSLVNALIGPPPIEQPEPVGIFGKSKLS